MPRALEISASRASFSFFGVWFLFKGRWFCVTATRFLALHLASAFFPDS